MTVTTDPGSITLRPLCINDSRGVLFFSDVTMTVEPQPITENSKVMIQSQVIGSHKLELYDVSGREVKLGEWTQSGTSIENHEFTLNKSNFHSGVYQLVLKTESGVIRQTVVVVE